MVAERLSSPAVRGPELAMSKLEHLEMTRGADDLSSPLQMLITLVADIFRQASPYHSGLIGRPWFELYTAQP